jgi:hypothetical protein
MGIAKLAAIGMIALTTMTQTGWGQDTAPRTQRETELLRDIERLRNQIQAMETRLLMAGIDIEEALKTTTPFIDLSFPGGSLASLVERLKERDPRANIILRAGAGDVTLPAFQAFEITPAGAIWVAKSVVESDWNLHVSTVDPGDGSEPTTVVRASKVRPASEAVSWMAPSKAWNLRTWMSDNEERVQGAFAAIQVGLESFGDSPIELKYHEPTGVLMARGNQAQIEFIESIIQAAAASSSREPFEVQNAPSVIAGGLKRIVEIKGEIAVLEARAGVQQARIDELIADQVGGEGLAIERVGLAEIEAAIAKLRFEQEQLEAAVENAKKVLADYEAKNKR